jgi:hypothetical protein
VLESWNVEGLKVIKLADDLSRPLKKAFNIEHKFL